MRYFFDPSLYLVIGPENCQNHSMLHIVAEAIAGGVSLVQYRNKQADFDQQIKDVQSLLFITKEKQIPLIVNDNIDVAIAAKADGVHLGQGDINAKLAREKLGQSAIIGLTVKNMIDVKKAPIQSLDYFGIGGVFPTNSKNNPDAAIGLDGLGKMTLGISKISNITTTAIAGINKNNCQDVVNCGVDGIAIISSICNSHYPKKTAQSIRNKINHIIGKETIN